MAAQVKNNSLKLQEVLNSGEYWPACLSRSDLYEQD